MKKLQDNDFERLNRSISLNNETKDKMLKNILNTKRTERKNFIPKLLSIFITVFAVGIIFFLVINPLDDQLETSQGEIVDTTTPVTLPKVEVTGNLYTIEWLSDSMDRGNHDLKTNVHGNLVIAEDIETIDRGNVLYYQLDGKSYIGRVVGLPGETVEIQEGQVVIDKQALNTFYGVATSLGLTEDEYFEKVTSENVNIEAMKEYFNTSMEPVKVEEDMYFILIDMWWRGVDSRDLGLISIDQIEGQIIGYEK